MKANIWNNPASDNDNPQSHAGFTQENGRLLARGELAILSHGCLEGARSEVYPNVYQDKTGLIAPCVAGVGVAETSPTPRA